MIEPTGSKVELRGSMIEPSGSIIVHLYQVLDFFEDGKTFLIDNIQRVHLLRSRLIF
ncbi:MAG: hypothetical protein LBL06_02205 [Treponema sp.]|jgi:hypothetical protein|nr:hypothetical protein [Treponema sp.]